MDKWLEYWQQDKLQPDVFTDKNGNKHQALLEFWRASLGKVSSNTSVIDIASGAGAVFRCLTNLSEIDAHALDISADALAILQQDMPSVTVHATYLNDTSFSDTTFDVVVSQFGIEYLGWAGFLQVPRLLHAGGKCVFLCHIQDGAVDIVTQQSLKGLKLIADSRFLQKARGVAEAFKQDQRSLVEEAVTAFMAVEPSVAKYCEKVPSGHHQYLYDGVKTMLSNYNQYDHSQLIAWIETALVQMNENIERLSSMHKAAMNQDDINTLKNNLADLGLMIDKAEPFYLRAQDPPVAWEIHGTQSS